MPATAGAAVTPAQMIGGGKHHQPLFIVIIAGQNLPSIRPLCAGTMKSHHALGAEAGQFAQFLRHLRDQSFGDFEFGTPARAFVSGNCTQLALVGPAAQRTNARSGFSGGCAHFSFASAGLTASHTGRYRRKENPFPGQQPSLPHW